ncbi:uncharacterized protein LOC124185550 [Neodiprion fabricii]|uniref:uncharacterized protein LOC124185550 n=1 Tax=Neodiprion fabricii TaxID=2872261 RepID=UPI001ED9643B|nr:uncharacterized protein LOC124185550 [Neodiprion fabricii]
MVSMKQRVTLRTAINVTRYPIAPIASWPLPRRVSRLNVALHNFRWWFSILHTISNSYGWFYNVYSHSGDPDVMIRALSEIGALYSTIFKMLICKIEAPGLQYLIAEMQEFLDKANDKELELIQQYVDKCLRSHIGNFSQIFLSVHILAKYVFFELVSALELFLFTWPADNLIDKTEKIGYAAYGCTWDGKPSGMLHDLLIVMLRAKSPAVIPIDGLLTILSLELYGSTMSASFSYPTTLRVIAVT